MTTTTDSVTQQPNKRAEALAKARAAKAAKKDAPVEVVDILPTLNIKEATAKYKNSSEDMEVWLSAVLAAMKTTGCNHPKKVAELIPIADAVLVEYNKKRNELVK